MSGASIGIMDPAYFVGRKAILDFINETFDLNLAKIEDTCSGAVACQLVDAIYPGEVNMSKVKWDAKSAPEYIQNYKILQRVFDKKGVDKYIDVEKLVRGKYQDNLEFMQWLKSFYDKNFAGGAYDAAARRAQGKGGAAMPGHSGAAGGGGIRKPTARPAASGAPRGASARAAASVPSVEEEPAEPALAPKPKPAAPAKRTHAAASAPTGDGSSLAKRVEVLDVQVADLKLSVEGLEKERDFYFGKLRDIEILLQAYTGPEKELSKQIFDILYATEDDFVIADGEGEVGDKENLS